MDSPYVLCLVGALSHTVTSAYLSKLYLQTLVAGHVIGN